MTFIQEIKNLVRNMMNKPPSVVRIIFKLGFILLGILFWVSMFQVIWEEIIDTTDTATRVRYCDNYYYAKDYVELREELDNSGMEDQVFDKYREVVYGYNDYLQYVQYKKAVAAGHEESKERMEQYCQKVMDNANNCKFEDNKKQLQEYVDKLAAQ